jgi:hypothetical protein
VATNTKPLKQRSRHVATNTKPLKQRSTDELETAIQSGYFDNIQKSEAERILRKREREPDRKRARRTYNAAAWAQAYSVIVALNCCILALIILWLSATGETSGQAPRQPAEAAEPETSLLAAPPIETAKPETSSLAVPPIAAPQEPLPSAEAHPAGAAPTIASPEEPLATPTPPNAVSTGAQPTAPAADVKAPSRRRTSSRPRRSLSAPRQTTDAWKKGISIFGQ